MNFDSKENLNLTLERNKKKAYISYAIIMQYIQAQTFMPLVYICRQLNFSGNILGASVPVHREKWNGSIYLDMVIYNSAVSIMYAPMQKYAVDTILRALHLSP